MNTHFKHNSQNLEDQEINHLEFVDTKSDQRSVNNMTGQDSSLRLKSRQYKMLRNMIIKNLRAKKDIRSSTQCQSS